MSEERACEPRSECEGRHGMSEERACEPRSECEGRHGMSAVLVLESVSRAFGSLRAVDDVTLSIVDGARHAIIGPNGAGKSTLFNLIGGSLRPSAGRIRFGDTDLTTLPEWRRARLGLARTFQHSSLLLHCTVRENVLVGVYRVAGVAASLLPLGRRRRAELAAEADRLLALVGLADRAPAPAGALSHGERRQLEVAMALAARPRLLLLDEPAAGMSPAETARLSSLLAGLPRDVTVLLIEHDLDVVFTFADTVTVLHLGRHLMTGPPAQVRAAPAVQEAYLGGAPARSLFLDAVDDEVDSDGPVERAEA
jgi:branched-chain amino acid transport system ATP-binding protein